MRWFALLAVLSATAVLAGCQTCSDPTPRRPVADQPLGAACLSAAECAAGLSCTEGLCVTPCQGSPPSCPDGRTCFDGRYCLPACQDDADCLLGATVGACAGPPATEPPYCIPRVCHSDAECPEGRCAGLSLASGITWNEFCSTGLCQR